MHLQAFYQEIDSSYEEVLERFCGDEDLLGMFVVSFAEEPTFGKLTAAVQAADPRQVRYEAHTLKGVAANLGFEGLRAACEGLDLCVRREELEQIAPCYAQVEAAYRKVVNALGRLQMAQQKHAGEKNH